MESQTCSLYIPEKTGSTFTAKIYCIHLSRRIPALEIILNDSSSTEKRECRPGPRISHGIGFIGRASLLECQARYFWLLLEVSAWRLNILSGGGVCGESSREISTRAFSQRRIWMPPHLLETISLQETIALGFATYENAKAARAKSVFLSPADPARRENGSRNIDSVSDNANSYQTEASEELDALLSSEDDEEGEDEVTSSITFADSEEFWGCSGASDEMDQSKKWRQAGIAGAKQNDADIGEFNLEKRRHGDADGDVHLPSPKCRNLQ
ncbi:hypothetical protein SUGI_0609400 [Cryptomeria japonica]|nr:hypothetical protein SUGI_0609400 [Cryptomeria japonica]